MDAAISVSKTSQLISGLKRHKKQAKLLQSTLDSLKWLPIVGERLASR